MLLLKCFRALIKLFAVSSSCKHAPLFSLCGACALPRKFLRTPAYLPRLSRSQAQPQPPPHLPPGKFSSSTSSASFSCLRLTFRRSIASSSTLVTCVQAAWALGPLSSPNLAPASLAIFAPPPSLSQECPNTPHTSEPGFFARDCFGDLAFDARRLRHVHPGLVFLSFCFSLAWIVELGKLVFRMREIAMMRVRAPPLSSSSVATGMKKCQRGRTFFLPSSPPPVSPGILPQRSQH